MYCKLFKLINGEDIIAYTEDPCTSMNDQSYVGVIDPVKVNTVHIPKGRMVIETYTMQPWMKLGKTKLVQVPTRNIVVVVDLEEKAAEQYKEYIQISTEPETEEEPTLAEKLLDDLIEDEVEENNEYRNPARTNRRYH